VATSGSNGLEIQVELRVRPKTSSWITEFSEHEADGCEFQKRKGAAVEIFPVPGVELILGRLPVTMNEPGLIAEQLFDEPNVVAAGAESPWAKKRSLSLADLMEEPWVLAQPGSLARSLQDEA
jgi:hypothetical protein